MDSIQYSFHYFVQRQRARVFPDRRCLYVTSELVTFAQIQIIFMRILRSFTAVIIFLSIINGCKSSKSTSDCDAACPKDTLKFSNPNHKLKPYVYVSVKDCKSDTMIWSYSGMGVNRKIELP